MERSHVILKTFFRNFQQPHPWCYGMNLEDTSTNNGSWYGLHGCSWEYSAITEQRFGYFNGRDKASASEFRIPGI
jgi:hypothetical protein